MVAKRILDIIKNGGVTILYDDLIEKNLEEVCSGLGIRYIRVNLSNYGVSHHLYSLINVIESHIDDANLCDNDKRDKVQELSALIRTEPNLQYSLLKILKYLTSTCISLIHIIPNESYLRNEESEKEFLHNTFLRYKNSTAIIYFKPKPHNYMSIPNNIKKVYISYKHSAECEKNIEPIENGFQIEDIPYSIDRKDVPYRVDIRAYEKEIGGGYMVIMYVVKDYLFSAHCMHEMVEIFDNQYVRDRIFPIIDLVDFPRDSEGLQTLIDYWNNERTKQLERLKTNNSVSIKRDFDDACEILLKLDEFWNYIKDINTDSIENLLENDAAKLIESIKVEYNRINNAANNERPVASSDTELANAIADQPQLQPELNQNVNQTGSNAIFINTVNGNVSFSR